MGRVDDKKPVVDFNSSVDRSIDTVCCRSMKKMGQLSHSGGVARFYFAARSAQRSRAQYSKPSAAVTKDCVDAANVSGIGNCIQCSPTNQILGSLEEMKEIMAE